MPHPLTRRTLLSRCLGGFAATAFTALNAEGSGRSRAGHGPHHRAAARNVIFLYMDGGPSQVDTFDPKPALAKYAGRPPASLFDVAPTQFDDVGTVLPSPWGFRRYGESGIPVSDLFPHVGRCVDDLAVIRSMTSEFPEHTSANYFLHSGLGLQGRPSMGAWVTYGLGSEARDLPGFVVLDGGLIPPGGIDCFGSGFLPASYQGSVFRPTGTAVANVTPLEASAARRRGKLDLVRTLDGLAGDRFGVGGDGTGDAVESAIANQELAFRMQSAVPDLSDLSGEPRHVHRLYGTDDEFEPTRVYAAECLLARRLVERGVRFVELTCPQVRHDRWDQHSKLRQGHADNARAVDRPIAGLLTDLKRRGLLDETLVVWAGEFGRTPFAQRGDGRDHNPHGFTVWLAGGGVRGGTVHGATDAFGYRAVAGRVEVHDLHATMLHLLGVDHTRSTVRHGGRDMRLTDVKGRVVREVVA